MLLVHLSQMVDTGVPDILVQGGVRITDLPYIWAVPAAALFSGTGLPSSVTSDQRQQIVPVLPASPGERDRTLVILTRDRVWNGIDYLEVLDSELPAPPPASTDPDLRQKVLLLHLFLPVPPDLASGALSQVVLIQGGVRITQISASWALSAATLVAGDFSQVPADEIAQLTIDAPFVVPLLTPLGQDVRRHILVVRTDVSGDFSSYELSIIDPLETTWPLDGFDQQLSRLDFSFKVECPTEFDCLPDNTCPPAITQAPVIDYLAKDYASFRDADARPDGADHPRLEGAQRRRHRRRDCRIAGLRRRPAELLPGRRRQRGLPGHRRERPSLRRHARLLDYTPREGTNARTFVHLEVALVGDADGQTAAGPSRRSSAGPRVTETEVTEAELEAGLQRGSQVFETMEPVTLHAAHNEIQLLYLGRPRLLPAQGRGARDAQVEDERERFAAGGVAPGHHRPESTARSWRAAAWRWSRRQPEPRRPARSPAPSRRAPDRGAAVARSAVRTSDVVDIAWDARGRAAVSAVPAQPREGDARAGLGGAREHRRRGSRPQRHRGPADAAAPAGPQRFLAKLAQGPITFQAQVLDAAAEPGAVRSTPRRRRRR